MRSYHLSGKARRRGQALLLAVLIMIFAALLSAAFIGIVATNLNTTARQSDKNRSVEAANAGLKYVNEQLTNSADGDRWRTEMDSIPPAPGDPDYNFYYTPMEIAQGWARTTPHQTVDLNGNGTTLDEERMALDATRATGKLELVKIPDPRTQPNATNTFLSQVQRLPLAAGSDLAGTLKITVIGVSPDDPTAYHRLVAYKGGFQRAPLAQTMRVVTNWDFKSNLVPVGQVDTFATNIINLKNVQGTFPDTPFTVVIGDPLTNVGVRGATVISRTGNALTIAPLPGGVAAPAADERVELAANLGSPVAIDYRNDGTPDATEAINFKTSDPSYDPATASPTPTPMPGGTRVNGGLLWTGPVAAEAMGGLGNAFSATNPMPASMQSSGLMAIDTGATTSVALTGQGFNGSGTGPSSVVDSKNANFPGTGNMWPTDPTSKDLLVSDGWNRLRGTPFNSGSIRSVAEFRPPSIDSGKSLERYRDLTRFSSPAISTEPVTASLYGMGQGIYIDNTQDIEKKDATPKPVAMTQSELIHMWLSPQGSTEAYTRSGPLAAANSTTASLEDQHLRGWVGPDEFRARGVEVELGNNTLIITRDSRDDNNGGTSAAYGPVPEKAWKDAAGNLLPGVYRKVFPWPANGVLFAEGNIRIKGNAINVPRSLTVVSMGNIYIEDSLSADDAVDGPLVGKPRKILLLAKKNVVMNPTRVLGRPDAQTLTSTASTLSANASVALDVSDSTPFVPGDVVETASQVASVDTVSSVSEVTAVNSATQLQVTVLQGGAVAAGSSLRSHRDIFTQGAATDVAFVTATPSVPYSQISAAGQTVNRRFNLLTANPNLRFAIDHQADRIVAPTGGAIFQVETEASATPPGSTKPASGVIFSHKKVMDATPAFVQDASTVSDLNKLIRGDLPTGSPESVPGSTNLDDTKTALEALTHSGPATDDWHYKVTVNPAYATLPMFYLAGVGNRHDYSENGVFPTAAPLDWRAEIHEDDVAANAYQVPLATSISMHLNGVAALIGSEHWNGTAYDQTPQFGFSPTYQDVSAATPSLPEDILTGDQSFYQSDVFNSTIDSRSLGTIPLGTNSVSLLQSSGITMPAGTTLPNYRLLGMKLENVGLTPSASTINSILPAHTFDVDAYVYAQTGSWFVIPGGNFEPRLRAKTFDPATGAPTSTYFDANNSKAPDKGEYLDTNKNNTCDAGEYADLNRDGIIEDSEKYALARYSRYNYSISFLGAIAENQTALVNDAGTAKGAVSDWMSKWATTTLAAGTVTHDRIKYVFDPTVLDGKLEDDPTTTTVDETDYGFRLPQTSDLFDVS